MLLLAHHKGYPGIQYIAALDGRMETGGREGNRMMARYL